MSNRTKSLERAKVSYTTDCLEALLDSCHRNGRVAKFPEREAAIPSDTEMFRWMVTVGLGSPDVREELLHNRLTLVQWREFLRKSIKEYPSA